MSKSMAYKGYAASRVFDAGDKIVVGQVLDIDDVICKHVSRRSEVMVVMRPRLHRD